MSFCDRRVPVVLPSESQNIDLRAVKKSIGAMICMAIVA